MDPVVAGAMRIIIQEAQHQGFQVWWSEETGGWKFVTPEGEALWFHPRTQLDVVHVLAVLISFGLAW